MSIPPIQKQLAQKQLENFCAKRIPPHLHDRIRLEYTMKNHTVTLVERRPHWNDASAPWTTHPIASMVYEPESMKWQLYWIRGNGKKERYDSLPPQLDLQKCLDEIDRDPLAIFWG